MEEHLEKVCVKTVVKCKFFDVGCEYECQRHEMEEHLHQGMKDHLELSTLKISRLEDKVNTLEDKVNTLQDQHQKDIKKVKQEIATEHQMDIKKVKQVIAAEHQKDVEKVRRGITAVRQNDIKNVRQEIAAVHQKDIKKVKQEIAAEHQKDIKKAVKQEIAAVHQKEIEKVKQEIAAVHQKDIKKVKQEIAAVHQKDIEKVKQEIAAVHQKEIEKVKQEIAAAHQKTQEDIEKVSQTCVVIITGFNRKLTGAKNSNILGTIIGDSFLTSSLGYKIKMRVDLNETREEFKDHMAVFLCLTKTDHDAMLSWPFKKKCTFTLIDQQDNEQERTNIVRTLTPAGEDQFKRPKDEENQALGFPDFVSHATLKTRKYIKDDTVFITVDTEP